MPMGDETSLLAHHHPDPGPSLGAERQADADLASPPRHAVAHQTEQADAIEQHGARAELARARLRSC